jgi:hypothetical protein
MAEKDYRISPEHGRVGRFSPEGSAILQGEFGEGWPDMRQWIAESRTGSRSAPMGSDIPGYGGMDPAKQRLLLFLLQGMSEDKTPGAGTPWANAQMPRREGLGDAGQFIK